MKKKGGKWILSFCRKCHTNYVGTKFEHNRKLSHIFLQRYARNIKCCGESFKREQLEEHRLTLNHLKSIPTTEEERVQEEEKQRQLKAQKTQEREKKDEEGGKKTEEGEEKTQEEEEVLTDDVEMKEEKMEEEGQTSEGKDETQEAVEGEEFENMKESNALQIIYDALEKHNNQTGEEKITADSVPAYDPSVPLGMFVFYCLAS